MADVISIKDADVYANGKDLTTQIRATALVYGAEPLDKTTLGDDTRKRTGGLKTVAFSHEGFWQDELDDEFFNDIGVSNVVLSVGSNGSSEGSPAYMFRALKTEYSPRGQVGELFGYGMTAEGDEDLIRGTVLRNSTLVGSSNGTGTAFNLGTSTGKVLGAHLHVLAETTNSSTEALTVTIVSDASSGMGSPTTRITFTATTGTGGEYKEFTTGTTDSWWQQRVTSPTSSAKFSVVVVAGLSTLT